MLKCPKCNLDDSTMLYKRYDIVTMTSSSIYDYSGQCVRGATYSTKDEKDTTEYECMTCHYRGPAEEFAYNDFENEEKD